MAAKKKAKAAPRRGNGLADILGDDVVAVPVGNLKEDPNNARTHDERNLATIRESVERFGWKQIIVARRDGTVIAGNARLRIAREMGVESVPVLYTDMTAKQAQAFALVDNRTAELADWDPEELAKQLPELGDLAIGWSDAELAKLLADDQEFEQDEVPPTPDETVSKLGSVIMMGEHRLVCGDSSVPDTVEKALGGQKPTIVVTDPPYGVAIGAKNRMLNEHQKSGRRTEDIKSDDLNPEDLSAMILPVFKNVRANMADDCTVFVTAPQGGELGMMMMMQQAGLRVRHVLIWKKNSPTFSMGRLDYDYAHEPILLTWGKKHKRPMGGPHRSSVWEIDKPRSSPDHPTMKPVELYANALLNNSDVGDLLFDPFAGSGTAFIAAEQTNRRCVGIELDPSYTDVIVARWEAFTGDKAKRLRA